MECGGGGGGEDSDNVRECIPSRLVNRSNFPCGIGAIPVEIHFRNTKWLMCGAYHPSSQNHKYFLLHGSIFKFLWC